MSLKKSSEKLLFKSVRTYLDMWLEAQVKAGIYVHLDSLQTQGNLNTHTTYTSYK